MGEISRNRSVQESSRTGYVVPRSLVPATRSSSSYEDTEAPRLSALDAFGLFEGPADDALQSICALAARLCGSPNAVINIFDSTWQRPLVCVGLQVGPLLREDALCELVVETGQAVYAADAAVDSRLDHSPFVDGRLAEVHMYLSLPLTTADDHTLGTLCIYDDQPRELDSDQIESVQILTRQVMAVFELRKAGREIADLAERAKIAEAETREVMDHAADAFVSVDPAGRITTWNDAAATMFGYSADEATGREVAELLSPPDRRRIFRERMAEAAAGMANRVDTPVQLRAVRSDGSECLLAPCIWTTRTPTGALKGFHAFLRDITATANSERARQEAERLFQAAFDYAPLGMMVVDVRDPNRGEIVRVNEAMQSLFPRIHIVGTHFSLLVAEDSMAESLDKFAALSDGTIDCYEGTRKLTTDGETHIWVHSTAALVRDADGAPQHALVQVRDVTRERSHEEWLTRQATSDSLTGLPNRLALMERLDAALTGLRNDRRGVGVLFLDVDGFKKVNDVHGHAAGDQVLREIANYLAAAVPEQALVGRLGGDEFAIVTLADNSSEVQALGLRLSAGIGGAVEIPGVGGSAGWAWTRDPATAAGELLSTADRRMYEHKRSRSAGRAP
jgi:diguanylate cyclase (GGDEF)-like protein/PAS domain S-box-containing protein